MKLKHGLFAGLVLVWPMLAIAGDDSGTITAVPEPEMLALLAIGGVALAIARWRARK